MRNKIKKLFGANLSTFYIFYAGSRYERSLSTFGSESQAVPNEKQNMFAVPIKPSGYDAGSNY